MLSHLSLYQVWEYHCSKSNIWIEMRSGNLLKMNWMKKRMKMGTI